MTSWAITSREGIVALATRACRSSKTRFATRLIGPTGRVWKKSSTGSTGRLAAGINTSNTAANTCSRLWTNGFEYGCEASCADGRGDGAEVRGADHQRWPNAFFVGARAVLHGDGSCAGASTVEQPLTGEPDAGNPPVGSEGGGEREHRFSLPLLGPPSAGKVAEAT